MKISDIMNDRTRLKIAWWCIFALAVLSIITFKPLIITFGVIGYFIPCMLIGIAGLMIGKVLEKTE